VHIWAEVPPIVERWLHAIDDVDAKEGRR